MRSSMGYEDICKTLATEKNWTTIRNTNSGMVYSYKGGKGIIYDTEETISSQIKLLCGPRFAGITAWSVDWDDFNGACGRGRYPMISEIHRTFSTEPECDYSQDGSSGASMLVAILLPLAVVFSTVAALLLWGWNKRRSPTNVGFKIFS